MLGTGPGRRRLFDLGLLEFHIPLHRRQFDRMPMRRDEEFERQLDLWMFVGFGKLKTLGIEAEPEAVGSAIGGFQTTFTP